MMKRTLGMLLLLVATMTAFSQTKNIAVSGRVIEDETKEPAIQATVQLLSLPDSTQAAGAATLANGYFTLPKVKAGKYVLKLSYIGFKEKFIPLTLTNKTTEHHVGTLTLESDAVMLAEAVVTAEVAQVQVKEDTLVYNSAAYRTPEGAMLEELVKKLPGAEIDDDGNVKINGKDLSKIMVNGKEFFGGDVKTGLKNLPVDMIDKLKTYDKKSDEARITGIDDGEEETVLDLTVKKGMNKGVFGNFNVAAGTEDRYSANGNISYFNDNTQVTIIGGANNVNDQGFSGGGGGPRWRRNNGLTATKTLGVNFATETPKLEMGGSARYNYRDNDVISTGSVENFLANGNSYSNSNSVSGSRNVDFNADFRLEWKPDTMTTILFRPNFSYGDTRSSSASESATFSSDPYAIVSNPNDYLKLTDLTRTMLLGADDEDDSDPLKDIRVNTSNSRSLSEGNSLSFNARMMVNRKLSSTGRNISIRGNFSYGDSDSEQYSYTDTRYYQSEMPNSDIRRYITTPTNNYSYSVRLMYSEPIARATFLQFSYQFQHKYSESDKSTYDLSGLGWEWGEQLPGGYQQAKDEDQSKYAEYNYYNHDATVALRFIRTKWQLSTGFSFQPQNTKLSYEKGSQRIDTTRNVFNFAPNVELRIRFSKLSRLDLRYRGRSSQPSMENLLPITDDSNPLDIRTGNPGLKPSFSHNMDAFYNTYNAELQRGIMTHLRFSLTQNSISNKREYNASTGGWKTMPENINGNWNMFGMFGFNTALPNKKYTVNSFSNFYYGHNVGYLVSGNGADAVVQKNTTTNLNLGERVRAAYRNDWLEVGLDGSFSYSWEKDKLQSENNQNPYTFSYGGSVQVMAPWSMTLTTNISNQARRGYTDSSMNRNEVIWNAQLSQTFLKGNGTLSFEMYDILKQQSNITRSLTASGRSVYQYNGVNSYCMLRFTYRLNIFGSKEAREKMNSRRMNFGPGGPGGRPGGPGGRRPF